MATETVTQHRQTALRESATFDRDVIAEIQRAAREGIYDIRSFGALSAPAKEALGRGANMVGTSTTTGDGGMTPEERGHSKTLVYQLLPSRYGMNPDDQRKACRHPDWTGPDDLEIKIEELREITDWEKPIFIKIGATRTYFDVALAVKAGRGVVLPPGMQGGTAGPQ